MKQDFIYKCNQETDLIDGTSCTFWYMTLHVYDISLCSLRVVIAVANKIKLTLLNGLRYRYIEQPLPYERTYKYQFSGVYKWMCNL